MMKIYKYFLEKDIYILKIFPRTNIFFSGTSMRDLGQKMILWFWNHQNMNERSGTNMVCWPGSLIYIHYSCSQVAPIHQSLLSWTDQNVTNILERGHFRNISVNWELEATYSVVLID